MPLAHNLFDLDVFIYLLFIVVVAVQSPGHVWLCNPKDCSMAGLSAPHHLPEFTQIHVHCTGDVIQPAHPLTLFFCPQSFLPSGNLPMSQLFASDIMSFAWSTVTKNPPANAGDSGDTGSILVPRRRLGRGHGDLLQYSCLENTTDRGAKVATVHGISESDTDEHKPWHMQQLFDNKHTISWFSSLWSLS